MNFGNEEQGTVEFLKQMCIVYWFTPTVGECPLCYGLAGDGTVTS